MAKIRCPKQCDFLAISATEEDINLLYNHDMLTAEQAQGAIARIRASQRPTPEPPESVRFIGAFAKFKMLACEDKKGYMNCARYNGRVT